MKRVLVTPLDWGFGHASRCVPIVRALLDRGCTVFLAGTGDSLKFLTTEFPELESYEIPGYEPAYPTNASMVTKMSLQLPKFVKAIRGEHRAIEKLVTKLNIDLIISDNRYGAWSEKVRSVFITHQSNILMPKRFGWLQPFVRHINIRCIEKFSRCWIPDFPEEHSLAGDLISFGKAKPRMPVDYLGPLTRFRKSTSSTDKYTVTAIFSGPEPQRTLLERIVRPQLEASGVNYYMVRGVFSGEKEMNGRMVNFLSGKPLQELIESSEIIISRSGYSSIMDLSALGKKAILIPTPGQTEQEYLARRLKEKHIAFSMSQEEFNLRYALGESKKYTGFVDYHLDNDPYLQQALDHALGSSHRVFI